MNASAGRPAPASATRRVALRWGPPLAAGLLACGLGASLAGTSTRLADAWLLTFVTLAGLAAGSLGLLMIGHLLGERWLEPVRDELEAAALTTPLLLLLALPAALALGETFPWAADGAKGLAELPEPRAAYLQPAFFLARGVLYLGAWTALAAWITRSGRHRRASVAGLALLGPTLTLAAVDWVMSREPMFWSSVFGFAFALSQLVAALAGAILASLLRLERPAAARLRGLERALLTLTLLAAWVWFVQFLVVWSTDLPEAAGWYLARRGWSPLTLGVALPALLLAVAVLVPPGAGRATMAVGSALLLVHHAAHMAWLVRPEGWERGAAWGDALVVLGLAAVWLTWFAAGLRGRERQRPEDLAVGPERPR